MKTMLDIESLQSKIAELEGTIDRLHWKTQCPNCKRSYRGDQIDNLKPSDAIVFCLRELDKPVGVGFLRKKIEAKGYPMGRFGPHSRYYYTLIGRLAGGGKIKRLEGDEIMLTG